MMFENCAQMFPDACCQWLPRPNLMPQEITLKRLLHEHNLVRVNEHDLGSVVKVNELAGDYYLFPIEQMNIRELRKVWILQDSSQSSSVVGIEIQNDHIAIALLEEFADSPLERAGLTDQLFSSRQVVGIQGVRVKRIGFRDSGELGCL